MNKINKRKILRDFLSKSIIYDEEINEYGISLLSESNVEKILNLKEKYNFALVCHISMLGELQEIFNSNNIDYIKIEIGEGLFDMNFIILISKQHEIDRLKKILV